MNFADIRSIFSKNFQKKKINTKKIFLKKTFIFFLTLESFFLYLFDLFFLKNLNISNNFKKKIYKFKIKRDVKIVCDFILMFKFQTYEIYLDALSYVFNIFFNVFNQMLIKLQMGIYGGWNSVTTLYENLFSFTMYIKITLIFIKYINVYNIDFFLLKKCLSSRFKIKKIVLCSIEQLLQFNFYNTINKLLLNNTIDDFLGNFLILLCLKDNFKKKYKLVIQKKLYNYQKKILKQSLLIRFFFKYIPKTINKDHFIRFVKKKFIYIKPIAKKKIFVFFLKIILKIISKNLFFFLNKIINTLSMCFFILFGCLNFIFYNSLYILFSKKKKLICSHKSVCITKHIHLIFNISVVFIYFKKFFKVNKDKKIVLFHIFQKKISLNRPTYFYFIKWPIFYFITKKSIKKYQILNKYFLKIKSIQCILTNIWNFHKFIFCVKNFKFISINIHLLQNMLSLFKSITDHFILNNLELNWILVTKKLNVVSDFNLFMILHEKFLNRCIFNSYLFNPYVSKTFLRLFVIAILFYFFYKKIWKKINHITDHNFIFLNEIIIIKKNYNIEINNLIKVLCFLKEKQTKHGNF